MNCVHIDKSWQIVNYKNIYFICIVNMLNVKLR